MSIEKKLQTIAENEQKVYDAGYDKGYDNGYGDGVDRVEAPFNEVIFIDYDGTILYSYSLEETLALPELPPLPEHKGLICQGWNWTLEEIKEHNRDVTVGAMYITDDGKTRIYITLKEGRTSPAFGASVKGTVTVDWGDGTEPDTLTGTSTFNAIFTPPHNYASAGKYVISLTVDGKMAFRGESGDEDSNILRSSNIKNQTIDAHYHSTIKKVEIGDGVVVDNYGFKGCVALESITLPKDTPVRTYSIFAKNSSLKGIVIPKNNSFLFGLSGCSSLKTAAFPISCKSIWGGFSGCNALASLTVPNGVESIGHNYISNAFYLAKIIFPSSITTIASMGFYNCYGMLCFDFTRCTSVPSLGGANTFQIAEDCEILVPSALYDEWIAATNWSNYADYIVAR